MKIIISHDVDHLYLLDHLFKDLYIQKYLIRSAIDCLQKKITLDTLWHRICSMFQNKMHRVDELMAFDKDNDIPSTFFFGMSQGLGMSYSIEKAKPVISRVLKNGFDVGVHGIDFLNKDRMQKEHDDFIKASGLLDFGIRNHYVRYGLNTFTYMNEVDYIFDSTLFNKEKLDIQKPYKIGNMWEFPLHIMDVYICNRNNISDDILTTKEAILSAESLNMPYCTILFHDTQFDRDTDPEMMKWYKEIIKFCQTCNYSFISYREAIKELEN